MPNEAERTHKKAMERRRAGGEVKPRPTHPLRQARRDRADERADARAERTDAEQLALLDERPGESVSERYRMGVRAAATKKGEKK